MTSGRRHPRGPFCQGTPSTALDPSDRWMFPGRVSGNTRSWCLPCSCLGLLECGNQRLSPAEPASARESAIELPDQVPTVGWSLTISKAENLFRDDATQTLTATSSDTLVVAVSLAPEEGSYSLTFDPAVAQGMACVANVATEPEGDGSDDEQQPQGRSVTRTVGVTVRRVPSRGKYQDESRRGRRPAGRGGVRPSRFVVNRSRTANAPRSCRPT